MGVELDVDRLVDEQSFGAFNLALLFWSLLALMADGFEISSIGLATPHLIREWHVPASAMGPMLSASLFGIFVGSPLFGFIGDRYGRRFTIILGCLVFGLTTLGVVFAGNLTQLTVLRFVTGVGMGGLFPNTIALSSELSPKRLRAMLVILMFLGITMGSAVPPLVALWGVAEHGWRLIFVVGGVAPLVVTVGLFFFLPESVKYLIAHPGRRAELIRTVRRMRPDLEIPDDAVFVVPAAVPQHQARGIGPLFAGGLAPITLLLWVCFATTQMANFFLASWLPLLLEMKGVNAHDAAIIFEFYHIGGTLGGVLMALLLDRFGMLTVAVLLALACPAVVAFGLPATPIVLGLLIGFAGFSVIGGQFGNNAASGLIYPTYCRSKGIGLAFAAARIGSVLGPLVGAAMLGMHLPVMALLVALAGPMLLGAIASFVLAWLTYRRFGGWQLSEVAAT